MNRRSFLAAILAAGAAPAIVKADSLMRLWTPRSMRAAQAEINRFCGVRIDYLLDGKLCEARYAIAAFAHKQVTRLGVLPAGAIIKKIHAPTGMEVDSSWQAPVDVGVRPRSLIAYRPMVPADEPSWPSPPESS